MMVTRAKPHSGWTLGRADHGSAFPALVSASCCIGSNQSQAESQ